MRERFAIGLAALSIIACDRVTAPQARDAAEKIEHNVLSRDSGNAMILLNFPVLYDTSHLVPSDTIRVIRGGRELLLRATVIERAYLPPVGTDAHAIVRRMGVVWSTDATRDPHHIRLVFLVADDSVPRINDPDVGFTNMDTTLQLRVRVATNIEPGDEHEWDGRDGTLLISDGVPVGTCPFGDNFKRAPQLVGELADRPHPVTCDTRRFTITLSATMEHYTPDRARTELRIVSQETRGIRIATQCTGVREADPEDCWGFPKRP